MNVSIRPLQEFDAQTSYSWRNDKEVFALTTAQYDREISHEMELAWIKSVLAKKDDFRCAIEVDGQYVGNIYLTNIDAEKAEYHIFIGDKRYWGKGIAKKASSQILIYAFEKLQLSKVFLKVKQDHIRAIRLYSNLGFVKVSENNGIVIMELLSIEFSYNKNATDC